MIRRILIKDYMAHEFTEVELGAGVTVLTGPNNVGKSAVVEALRSVAQNPAPHHVVRHGAAQALVRVELDSGEAIEWVRSGSSAVYRLHRPGQEGTDQPLPPEVYAKFGRTVPEDIRNLLRLDLVETESGQIDIHIGNQRYPIFLLDQTGSQAASFFAASTEAEYLLKMQQALKTRTDRARSRRKELTEECAALEADLERYAPLSDLDEELQDAEGLHQSLTNLQRTLPVLESALHQLEATQKQFESKVGSAMILEPLAPPPVPQDTRGLETVLGNLEKTLMHRHRVETHTAAYEPLADPPVMHPIAPLARLFEALGNTQSVLRDRRSEGEALSGLQISPELHEIQAIETLAGALLLTHRQGRLLERLQKELDALPSPPQLGEVAPVERLIEQMESARRSAEFLFERGGVLQGLQEHPQLHDLKSIETLVAALREMNRKSGKLVSADLVLNELLPTPEVQPTISGELLLDRFGKLGAQLDANLREGEEIASAMASKRLEVEQLFHSAATCPLCGQPFQLDHFLEASHARE
jgi:hypothetical protein